MLIEAKDYYLDHIGTPTRAEITNAIHEYKWNKNHGKLMRITIHYSLFENGAVTIHDGDTVETILDRIRKHIE